MERRAMTSGITAYKIMGDTPVKGLVMKVSRVNVL